MKIEDYNQKFVQQIELLIPSIIANFDNVTFDTNKSRKECLIFEKAIGDIYFVIKEIRKVSKKGKKNRIILQTMYKRKTSLSTKNKDVSF